MNDAKYSDDRAFGDKFMPEVKSILGRFLLSSDFDEEDRKRNGDLITLTMDSVRIGVRIRRNYYYMHTDKNGNFDYRYQFTIRYTKDSGCETEFSKIMKGWGDYFFYGFADEEEEHLIKWIIGDFKMFRIFVLNQVYLYGKDALERRRCNVPNGDTFVAFNCSEVKGFVQADSEHWIQVSA